MTHSSWGPGWPSCQYSKINSGFAVATKWGIVKFPGGVRHEITELVARLVKETANRGYRFGTASDPSYGCWGFACRAIRGSTSPSNHSWGLAVDINAPRNPMGDRLITDMPGWMPDLWNAYGFRWGGDYRSRPDAMHYEFMGSVADAARHTQIARQNRLGEIRTTPPPPPPPTPFPGVDMATFFFRSAGKEWRLYDGGTMLDLPYEQSSALANEIVDLIDAAHKHVTGKPVLRRDNISPYAYAYLSMATQNKQDEAPGFVAKVNETSEEFFVTADRSSKVSKKTNPDEFAAILWVLVQRGFDMKPQLLSAAQIADIPELSEQ